MVNGYQGDDEMSTEKNEPLLWIGGILIFWAMYVTWITTELVRE